MSDIKLNVERTTKDKIFDIVFLSGSSVAHQILCQPISGLQESQITMDRPPSSSYQV